MAVRTLAVLQSFAVFSPSGKVRLCRLNITASCPNLNLFGVDGVATCI
ncbi:hypothetical protein [Histophilus somni]|nr:hypothetical protein [Histophilus somni]